MTPPQKRQNSITRYRLTEENLIGNVKEPAKNYDLLSVVILCLGGADDENYDGVPKLLDVLLSPEAVTRLPKTNSQANAAQLLSEQRRFSCAQPTELLGICSIW